MSRQRLMTVFGSRNTCSLLVLWLVGFLTPAWPSDQLVIASFESGREGVAEAGGDYSLNLPKGCTGWLKQCWDNRSGFLEIQAEMPNFSGCTQTLSFSTFAHSSEKQLFLPDEFAKKIKSLNFRAKTTAPHLRLRVTIEGKSGDPTAANTEVFIDGADWQDIEIAVNSASDTTPRLQLPKEVKTIAFSLDGEALLPQDRASTTWWIDDLRFSLDEDVRAPSSAKDIHKFVAWLKRCGLNYFLWNYRFLGGLDHGVMLKENCFPDLVTIESMGFGLAGTAGAVASGILDHAEGQRRVTSMLRWLESLGNRHDFPLIQGFPVSDWEIDQHKTKTTPLTKSCSTGQWALCCAGIRVASQYFSGDSAIQSLAKTLLNRGDWSKVWDKNLGVAHGFEGSKQISAWWGDKFTEEAILVLAEAWASGKIDDAEISNCLRAFRNQYESEMRRAQPSPAQMFWPTFTGSMHCYYWFQTWAGPTKGLEEHTTLAFSRDMDLCEKIGQPVMGLAACEGFEGKPGTSWIPWHKWLVNGIICPPNVKAVDHLLVCPSSAVAALPFVPTQALDALSTYINLSHQQTLWGLPHSIWFPVNESMSSVDIRDAWKSRGIPNWAQFAATSGIMWMSCDHAEKRGAKSGNPQELSKVGRVATLFANSKGMGQVIQKISAILSSR